MIAQKTFEEVLGAMSEGQRAAIIRKVARAKTGDETQVEQVIRAVLSGELKIVLVDGAVKFFNYAGCGIPMERLPGKVLDANRAFYLTQPTESFAAITARQQMACGSKVVLLSADEFEERCNVALERIKTDHQVANLLRGPYFAWQLPQLVGDIGKFIDDVLLSALERSYKAHFPGRKFRNYLHGKLAGQVMIVPDTRYERLIDMLRQGPVCGIYFPCLRGFSVQSSRNFIGHMPEQIILSGIEVLAAATAHPGVIGRDWHTPGLDMSALQWRDPECSLHCKARVGQFYFDYGVLSAYDHYASGVSVLG